MNIEIIELHILGAVTHYKEQIWVDSKRCYDGGYYRTIKRKYDFPKVSINFRAKVDIELVPNCIYYDGINQFMSISTNEIVNLRPEVAVFSIPDKLDKIASAFAERIT